VSQVQRQGKRAVQGLSTLSPVDHRPALGQGRAEWLIGHYITDRGEVKAREDQSMDQDSDMNFLACYWTDFRVQ
jgi:hypothetical protein